MTRLLICICTILFFSSPHTTAWAAEQTDLDDVLSGFDQEETADDSQNLDDVMEGFDDDAKATVEADENTPSPFSLNGHIKVGVAYNFAHEAPSGGQTDWRGLSRLKTEAGVELQFKWRKHWRLLANAKYFYDWAYRIQGREAFTSDTLEQYEKEGELGEAYIQGRLHRQLDVKAGRQIIVWGRSDSIRITDVLNPLDFREPGLVDIEDLRLPVTMTRLDSYWKNWNLTAVAGHEIRFNKNPAFGHDFFPGTSPLPAEEKPSSGGAQTEWALALNGIYSGKDLSFYWARLYDETSHVEVTPPATQVRRHARVTFWGVAGSLAVGDWLIIGEGAYWQGLEFFNATGETFDRIEGLIGIEYSGWTDTTLSLDWAIRRIIDFDNRIASAPDYAQKEATETALRISKNYFNDTLEIAFLAMLYGPIGKGGALERLSLQYDWNDSLSSTIGIALYQSGDKFILSDIDDNDRVFLEIKYSF